MMIRVTTIEDAPALARVLVDTERSTYRGQIPDEVLFKLTLAEAYAESERNWRRALQEIADDANPQACIYVAEDETHTVVGLGMGGSPRQEFLANSGEIYSLYVCEQQQGQGLGRALVQVVATYLAQQGMSALLIGCLATNTPARHFYEHLGGHIVAEYEHDEDGALLPKVVYGWSDIQLLVKK